MWRTVGVNCWAVVILLFCAGGLSVQAVAQNPPPENSSVMQNSPETQSPSQNARPAQPGSINYVEGQATIDGQPLSSSSVGNVQLAAGQTLATQTGKVEVLLTPGVFLRVGDNSSVKMISPDLTNTEVAVDKGEVMVEVTDLSKYNHIVIDQGAAKTRLLKKGLYDFDANQDQVRVFKGKARVDASDSKLNVGGHHLVALNSTGKLKSKNFDTKQYADELYRWSGLRSGYLAEADADAAGLYANGGSGWAGAGWYWDPWFDGYTFIPGNGIYYSPFGWGFYSPFEIWDSPFIYGGYGYGGRFYGHQHTFNEFHPPYGHGFEPRGGFHGGFHGGGFHGGGFHGGGFHGGGGHAGGGHR